MAKSKVDTKALEEINGFDALATSDNIGGSAIFDMAQDAVELLVTAFGTNDRTAKALARQLCSGTHFLLAGNDNYMGIRAHVMKEHVAVEEAEDKVNKDVAGAEAELANAKRRLETRQTEEADILALHKICCDVYKTETGEEWQPYTPNKRRGPLTRAERLAQRGIKVA